MIDCRNVSEKTIHNHELEVSTQQHTFSNEVTSNNIRMKMKLQCTIFDRQSFQEPIHSNGMQEAVVPTTTPL